MGMMLGYNSLDSLESSLWQQFDSILMIREITKKFVRLG